MINFRGTGTNKCKQNLKGFTDVTGYKLCLYQNCFNFKRTASHKQQSYMLEKILKYFWYSYHDSFQNEFTLQQYFKKILVDWPLGITQSISLFKVKKKIGSY